MDTKKQFHKIRRGVIVCGLLLMALLIWSPAAAATPQRLYQASEPTPVPTADPNRVLALSHAGQAEFSFRELGFSTLTLRYPADSAQFTIRLPYRWTIKPGQDASYINLKYDMLYQGPNTSSDESKQDEPAMIHVYVEDVLAASFSQIPALDQMVRIPIPEASVIDHQSNQYNIRITYQDAGDCDLDKWNANLIVSEESTVHLSFDLRPVQLKLSDFPRPLVNDSFLPERALIVIPDQFTDVDLTAAATISWLVGARARRDTTIETLTASEAAARGLENTSAILIGTPGENALLAGLFDRGAFPTTRVPGDENALLGPDGRPVASSDGVLQIAVSPVDANVFYLAVTGSTGDAILKAAQALSDDTPQYPQDSNLAIVGDIQDTGLAASSMTQDTFTLADLGMDDIVVFGLASVKESGTLFIPREWAITEDPTLDLHYLHSSQLNPANSSLNVELNGDIVGDAPIEEAASGLRRSTLRLSKEFFILGQDNRLSFELINGLTGDCIPFDTLSAWMRVLKTSVIHIPHEIAPDAPATFTDPITHLYQGTVSTPLLLVLPEELSTEMLTSMSAVAQSLGYGQTGPAQLSVVRDRDFDPAAYADYHMIVIGQPSTNAVLADLNDSLPQSFALDNNALEPQLGRMSYQIPPDYSIGVIEVIYSPWNPQRAVSIITGTTPEGLAWALRAVTSPDLANSLDYDLNFIRDQNIQSLDSKAFTPGTLEVAVNETISEQATEITTSTPAAEVAAAAATLPESTAVPTVMPTPTTVPAQPAHSAEDYKPQQRELDDSFKSAMALIVGLGVILIGGGFIWNARKMFRSFHE